NSMLPEAVCQRRRWLSGTLAVDGLFILAKIKRTMGYFPELEKIWQEYLAWLALARERGLSASSFAGKTSRFLATEKKKLQERLEKMRPSRKEPDSLKAIRQLRPSGPRRLTEKLSTQQLPDRLLGAWLGRAAGCILGLPCEGMSKEAIRFVCLNHAHPYPLSDYWSHDPKPLPPQTLHYGTTARRNFLKPHLSSIGADDDLAYTILGLLLLEEKGSCFTTKDVARAWLKYLPLACTAEAVALNNLKHGISPDRAGQVDNPYSDWIGADIRSDPWAYAAPGWPEKAAEMAYYDAFLSHRGTGIHAAMFFSAAISAAFVCQDPLEAIRIALTEIPRDCRLARTVRQTIDWCHRDRDWEKTTDRILKTFSGMSAAHALNNAAVTVASLVYGGGDFSRTIALAVMAGLDTDCNGATAGSLAGAMLGASRLPSRWKKPLGNQVHTYLKGHKNFHSDELAARFHRIALKVLDESI
ncbi:MAG TPA: ADP-ribosylglycohydrolase family protein, partial [bacterium]|nr:ADP-ribosylglycohydrolase family protein [bacterium]